jgi:hypothetical protein
MLCDLLRQSANILPANMLRREVSDNGDKTNYITLLQGDQQSVYHSFGDMWEIVMVILGIHDKFLLSIWY